MVSLNDTFAIFAANFLACYLVTIVIVPFQHLDDAAVYLAILHDALQLYNGCILVLHEDAVIITGFIHLLRHTTQRACHLLVLFIRAAFNAEYIGAAGEVHSNILPQIIGQRDLLPVVLCKLSLSRKIIETSVENCSQSFG